MKLNHPLLCLNFIDVDLHKVKQDSIYYLLVEGVVLFFYLSTILLRPSVGLCVYLSLIILLLSWFVAASPCSTPDLVSMNWTTILLSSVK